MDWVTIVDSMILGFAQPPPAGHAPNPKGQLLQMVGMFAIMGVMFYFVLIRPQQKRSKEHAALIQTLKPGDKILTSSGILGVVVTVKEKSVSIRSADSKMEIVKSAVSEITERANAAASS